MDVEAVVVGLAAVEVDPEVDTTLSTWPPVAPPLQAANAAASAHDTGSRRELRGTFEP